MNLLILVGQIKATTCDRAMEGENGAGVFREGGERKKTEVEEVEGRWSRITWPWEAPSSKGFHS